MADFSIGDALGSGFGLMGKRPVSVMAWGLTYLVVGMALPFWMVANALGPDFIAQFRNLHAGMTPPANFPQMMGPMQAKMMLFQPIMFLTTLVAQSILTAAVFRATLEPRNRGLAYLRIGPRELWLALLNFVMRILAVILLVALILIGVGLGFGLNAIFESQHVDWTARYCSFAALGFVMFAIFIGICVRFSLAAPMTFAESNFRLFESWRLTRRHSWKLFALGLLLGIVSVVMVLAFEAVIFAVILLVAGGVHWDPAAFVAVVQDQNRLWSSGVGEGMVAAALVGAYAFGGIFAVAMAPWAVAYRELLPRAPTPPAGGLFAEEPAPPPADPAPAAALVPAAALGAAVAAEYAARDGHGHADPHAPADDHGAADDHGHGDDHGHAEDHGHGDDHGAQAHGAPVDDGHGHADDHGHADPHAHADDHGHGDDGHDADHGHDAHGGEAHGHDDHGHGDGHGHDDGHGHGDDHGGHGH